MTSLRFLLTLALLASTLTSFAQYKGVIVEKVDNGGVVAGNTYRIYIELANEKDQVHVVYGDAEHPMSIESSKSFYQSSYGGAMSISVNRKASQEDPKLKCDSWVTIGSEDNYDNYVNNFLMDFTNFEDTGGPIKSSDGAWFCTPDHRQVFCGPTKKILIMQLTSEGKITAKFNIQGRTAAGDNFQQQDITFTTGK
ncbi:MAG: hypothetical protein SGI87_05400 [Flavobacteriales bacterium]|nr:hypothetical protein [Flavobacteriales bacterium]